MPADRPEQPIPSSGGGDELEAIAALEGLLPPAVSGETWIGDDAAVLAGDPGQLLFASDLVAEGIHFDRRLGSLADVGWKSLAVNLSDLAAMGGRPLRAVVAVAGAFGAELASCYEGLVEAATRYGCPVVGGDLSAAAVGGGLVVSVAVLGTSDGRTPVLRSGASPGDLLWSTGPLGAGAGLRQLRADPAAGGEAVARYRRPVPRLAEGRYAASCGARAMIDVSDGFGIDLHRLARASGVGVRLDILPVLEGATEEEALSGGEDYELLFATPPDAEVTAAFRGAGLRPPLLLGEAVADPAVRILRGETLPPSGFVHRAGDGG